MPSTSKKQAKLMAAVAHNPAFAKKVGIPQSVGTEFNKADKGRKFKEGGDMAKDMTFAEQVEADNRAAKKEANKKATKYRTDAMTENKKKGGMISEYGGAEKYKSKTAEKKHEKKEPRAMEMAEKAASKAVKAHEKNMHKGMKAGGSVKGYGMARGGRACKMA